jgi:hypothetical protein
MELCDVVASICSEFTRLPSCVCYSILPPQRQWLGIQTTSRGIFRVHAFYAAVVAITECIRPFQHEPPERRGWSRSVEGGMPMPMPLEVGCVGGRRDEDTV